MSSPSAVVCREIFDENSQPSAEEISEYAQQIGIDPESESHLLPLARDGLMQALPAPWKAYYDEKLQTHYYYNEESKKTQWEHPLDKVYKELVRKSRDASIQDDTCASVQELLTFEENPKILERVETKVESDDEDLTTDSSRHLFEKQSLPKRLPLGRPPLAPLTRLDKKLGDLRMSPLRRSIDNHLKSVKNTDLFKPPERPKQLFKQQSEIIDLKINVLSSPDEDSFRPLLGAKLANIDRGLPLTGKGSMFFKIPKSDNPSPDTDKSFPLDSVTKSDPPKGILREKAESVVFVKNSASLDEDKKSVRFKLENVPDPSTISPGSNSSSDQNEGQSSIVTPVPFSSTNPINPKTLAPIAPLTVNPIRSLKPLDTSKQMDSTKKLHSELSLDESKVWIGSNKESIVYSDPHAPLSYPDLPNPKLSLENNSPRVQGPKDYKSKDISIEINSRNQGVSGKDIILELNPRKNSILLKLNHELVVGMNSPKAMQSFCKEHLSPRDDKSKNILETNRRNQGICKESSKDCNYNVDNISILDDLKSENDTGTNNSKDCEKVTHSAKDSPKTDELDEFIPKKTRNLCEDDIEILDIKRSNSLDENSLSIIDFDPTNIVVPNISDSNDNSSVIDIPEAEEIKINSNSSRVDHEKTPNISKVNCNPEIGNEDNDLKLVKDSGEDSERVSNNSTSSIKSRELSTEFKEKGYLKEIDKETDTIPKPSDTVTNPVFVEDSNLGNNFEPPKAHEDEFKDTEVVTGNKGKVKEKNSSSKSTQSDVKSSENDTDVSTDSESNNDSKDNSPKEKDPSRQSSLEEENSAEENLYSRKDSDLRLIESQPNVNSYDQDNLETKQSPKRRVLRPPAADYIKPDLFQKNFQKISDLVRPGDIETSPVHLEVDTEKDIRPRSPLIPQQKNKISINLMESIESETSSESPDKEYTNLDLNDIVSNEIQKESDDSPEPDNSEKIEDAKEIDNENAVSNTQKPRLTKESFTDSPKTVPKLDFKMPKTKLNSDLEVSNLQESKSPKVEIVDNARSSQEIKSPQNKSPMFEFNKSLSTSNYKSLTKAVIAPLKPSETKSKLSPRLDGVILQGKSTDDVVICYQFESQDENYSKIRSPLLDQGKEILERNKSDERRRLELNLQKELESIRIEFATKERRMRAELQEDLRELEDKFLGEKKLRLTEQSERQKREMENALTLSEQSHKDALESLKEAMENRLRKDMALAEQRHGENMAKLEQEYRAKLDDRRTQLEIENERALSELRDQLQANFNRERTRMIEENRSTLEALREDHTSKVTELRHDYRAEVDRLRTQHACHLEELRARFANERAARTEDRGLADKYKCLKEKYARLKHDVKMSIERRNKRREMSMTTGSETEKSNSHKANQSLERCKELNETSVSAAIESEPRTRNNNLNPNTTKYNDNETSHSESNAARDNNNDDSKGKDMSGHPATSSQSQSSGKKPRRTTVAFKEPVRSNDRIREIDTANTTDYQDSSDATTADEKPKESVNGHGRRRCFTRLKSASTSRLNYSPKRGEGWSSPLEALRQQLRKLDDLEDQFPDLACQPNYSLRYPFGEIAAVTREDSPELEFVRHRALVEREGMRRARAVLKRRRAALKENSGVSHRAPSEDREATELEVALHRARALLGEKEIRLRHIERALRKMADVHTATVTVPPPVIQEATTSEASSVSETGDVEATGAVLRSLKALHADVRDIWRALDVRPRTASPEVTSFNHTSTQNRNTYSAPTTMTQDTNDIAERARGIRQWLQHPT